MRNKKKGTHIKGDKLAKKHKYQVTAMQFSFIVLMEIDGNGQYFDYYYPDRFTYRINTDGQRIQRCQSYELAVSIQAIKGVSKKQRWK